MPDNNFSIRTSTKQCRFSTYKLGDSSFMPFDRLQLFVILSLSKLYICVLIYEKITIYASWNIFWSIGKDNRFHWFYDIIWKSILLYNISSFNFRELNMILSTCSEFFTIFPINRFHSLFIKFASSNNSYRHPIKYNNCRVFIHTNS